MRRTLILGDPHVGHDSAADRRLLALLEGLAAETDLVIMGDLFVAWIARDRFLTEGQRRIVDALRALRGRGAHVRFVVGNRDYLAPGLAGDVFDAVYEGEVIVDVAGTRTLLLHGDGLVAEDRPYRIWRALSKNRASSQLIEHLPGALGRHLAARTERGMRDVNRQYKTGDLPRSALGAVGRRAAIAGAKRAIVGHFHADETIETAGVPVTVAPGWFEHDRVLIATEDTLESTSVDLLTSPVR